MLCYLLRIVSFYGIEFAHSQSEITYILLFKSYNYKQIYTRFNLF